jgi:hypothetical protein
VARPDFITIPSSMVCAEKGVAQRARLNTAPNPQPRNRGDARVPYL